MDVIEAFKCSLSTAIVEDAGGYDMPEGTSMDHLAGMLERMIADSGMTYGKKCRWLGWAQGVLVAHGHLTLDQCKQINKLFAMSKPNRFSRGDDGDFDEVNIRNPKLVHIERMDDGQVWMQVTMTDGETEEVWFEARKRNRIEMTVTGRYPQRKHRRAMMEKPLDKILRLIDYETRPEAMSKAEALDLLDRLEDEISSRSDALGDEMADEGSGFSHDP